MSANRSRSLSQRARKAIHNRLQKQRRPRLSIEALEDRTLLSVSAVISGGNTLTLTGGVYSTPGISGDNVWLKSTGGYLDYSFDGSTYYSADSNNNKITLVPGKTVTVTAGDMDTVHVVSLDSGGSSVIIQSTFAGSGAGGSITGPKDVTVEGNITTEGGDFNISQVQGIDVSANVTIDTRQLDGNGHSTANSGAVTLSSTNYDPLNLLININFNNPHVNLGANDVIQASVANSGGSTFTSGNVTLNAQNTSYSLASLFNSTFSAEARASNVTISPSSSISGNNVTITTNSGDMPVVNAVATAAGSASTWLGPVLQAALGIADSFYQQVLSLPIAVVYKDASATTDVGAGVRINADGGVTVDSTSYADATANSSYSGDTALGMSFSFSWAQSSAITHVEGNASITAGGDVNIDSTTTAYDPAMSSVSQDSSDSPAGGGQKFKVAASIGIAKPTATTNVDAGASVIAQGNVNVTANGTSATTDNNSSTAIDAETGQSPNGQVAQTIAVGIVDSDIEAIVNGTLISNNDQPSLLPETFNPYAIDTNINYTNSTIHFATAPGYSNGAPVVYSAGGGGALPGLTDGSTYYVIVPNPSDPNDIQLATTAANATASTPVPITFGQYPTLSGNGLTAPITNVDESAYTITYPFNITQWTTGTAVTYAPVAGQHIGGLNAGAYYISVDPGNPNMIRLANSQADANSIASTAQTAYNAAYNADITAGDPTDQATLDGEAAVDVALAGNSKVVALDQNPVFTWTDGSGTHSAAFTVDPSTQRITFLGGQGAGITTSTPLTYQAALGLSISSLQNGGVYYAAMDPSTNSAAIVGTDGSGDNLVDTTNNTITFNVPPGFQTGDAVIYHQGATVIGNLTDGATYYVVVGNNPNQIQLDSSQADAASQTPTVVQLTSIGTGGSFQEANPSAWLTMSATDAATVEAAAQNAYSAAHAAVMADQQTNKPPTLAPNFPANAADAAALAANSDLSSNFTHGSSTVSINSVNPATSAINFTANPGLVNGTAVVYHANGGMPIGGLTDGSTYYAVVGQAPIVPVGAVANPVALDVNDNNEVDTTQNTITFDADANFQTGDAVVYHAGSTAIGGLTDNTTYYVVQYNGQSAVIQLATSHANAVAGTPVVIDLTALGTGGTFQEATPVDTTANTISFSTPPGFQTGDAVVYNQGAALIGGLTNGATYYVTAVPGSSTLIKLATSRSNALSGSVINLTLVGSGGTFQEAYQFKLAASLSDAQADASVATVTGISGNAILFSSSPGFQTGDAVIYHAGSTPIGGLTDGATYWAVVNYLSPDQIELAATQPDSIYSTPNVITLTSSGNGTFQKDTKVALTPNFLVLSLDNSTAVLSGSTHTLTPQSANGITVNANLSDSPAVQAGSNRAEQPASSADLVTGGLEAGFAALKGAVSSDAGVNSDSPSGSDSATSGKIDSKTSDSSPPNIDYSGAIVFVDVNNTVLAKVGRTAVLNAGGSIAVSATIVESSQTTTNASVSAVEGQADPNYAAAVAITVGLYTNNTQTLIEDGAQLDAGGDTNISSTLQFPFLLPLNQPDAGQAFLTQFEQNPSGDLDNLVNGTLGLKGGLVANWGQTSVEAQKVSVGGVVTYLQYNDTNNAIVGWQDPNSTYTSSDHTKINQNTQGTGQQSVEVTAETQMDWVRINGNFDLNLSPSNVIKAVRSGDPSAVFNPVATAGGKGGIGGVVIVVETTNNTNAQIAGNVELYADPSQTLLVSAITQVLDITLSQAGGSGGQFGFAGTGAFYDYTNTTLAHIDSGVVLDVGAIDVEANDSTILATYAGGIAKSQHIGVGFTVLVNDLNRTTEAWIGNSDTDSSVGSSTINVHSGNITVNAVNSGVLVAVSYAASIVGPAAPTPQSHSSASTTSSASSNAASGDSGQQGSYGIGVSGDVSLNGYGDADNPTGIHDTVKAFIKTTGTITGGALAVTATNTTYLISLAGAVAAATNPSGTNVAIAGSYSQNTLYGDTEAYIQDVSNLTATSVDVEANRSGDIYALTAGVAASSGTQGAGVAGSVSVNSGSDVTYAHIAGIGDLNGSPTGSASASLAGDTTVKAEDQSEIWVIAGGVGFGGKAGVGAAVAVNELSEDTESWIQDSNITKTAGALTVDASDQTPSSQPRVLAIVGSVGVASSGAGVSGMVAINILTDTVKAYIQNSTIVDTDGTPGAFTVHALDDSRVISVGGSVGVGKVGLGAGVGYNQISNTVVAYLNGTTLTNAGSVTVEAVENDYIATGTIAVGAATNVALAGSVSVNLIEDDTDAHISGNSSVTTAGSILVSATDTSSIISVAGSVAGSSGNAALGAAVGYNEIENPNSGSPNITAYIDSSTVKSTGSTLTVAASATQLVIGIVAGGAGAAEFALGGSVAINTFTNSIDAHVSNNSFVDASGGVSVTANDGSTMFVVAGAFAFSGTAAVAGSVAKNDVGNTITAYVDDSTITSATNAVTVSAGFNAPQTQPNPSTVDVGVANITLPKSITDQVLSIAIGGSGAGTAAVAGSVTLNSIKNTIDAHISGSSVNPTGNVSVTTVDTSTIKTAAGGFAFGGDAGIGAAAAVNDIANTIQAYIDDSTVQPTGSVSVTSTESALVFAVTVGGGFSGTLAIGGSVTTNWIRNSVTAHISNNSNVKATAVTIAASDSSTINAYAGGLAGSGTAAIGASVAYNYLGGDPTELRDDITTDTSLNLTGAPAANDIPSGNFVITIDNEQMLVTGGQGTSTWTVQRGYNGTAIANHSANAAITYANSPNAVTAYIDSSNVKATNGDVGVTATEAATIQTFTVGAAGAAAFALGGAVSVNNIRDNVDTYINGSSSDTVQTSGQVTLASTDSTVIQSGAGGIAGSGAGAIGAGVSTNDIADTVNSYISGARVSAGTNVSTTATFTRPTTLPSGMDAQISSLAVGGAISGTVSIAGAVTLNQIRNVVTADINSGANVTAGGDVDISATDNSAINSFAGQLGLSLGGSVGAAAAYNDIGNTIQSYVTGALTSVTATGSFNQQANSTASIQTVSAGLSAGLGAGVAGSVAINLTHNDVETYVSAGANVTANNNANLLANSANTTSTYGGTAGIGAVGAAGTVVVNVFTSTTKAYLDDSALTAKGLGGTTAVKTWNTTTGAESTQNIKGVAVIATTTEGTPTTAISTITVTAAGGAVGIGLNIGVNKVGDDTEAYAADNSTIDSASSKGQTVDIIAHQSTSLDDKGGVISGGLAGIGAALDIGLITGTTKAYVDNSTVYAGNGMDVATITWSKFNTVVAGAAIGGVAIAGGATAAQLGWTNNAGVTDSNVYVTGNFQVTANDRSEADLLTGMISVGLAGGGGGAVGVALFTNSTTAHITGSTTDATGQTEVAADTVETVNPTALAAGAGGMVGIAGAVTVDIFKNTTTAKIESDGNAASVNADSSYKNGSQSVLVHAADTATMNDQAGSLGLSLGDGVGATVDVGILQDTVDAHIGSSANVNAGQNVTVEALATDNITPTVAAFAGGLDAGIAGAVNVISVGTGLTSQGSGQTSPIQSSTSSGKSIDSQIGLSGGVGNVNSNDATAQQATSDTQTNALSVNSYLSTNGATVGGTTAYIDSATVTAGGNVNVTSQESLTVSPNVGGTGVGAVGIGGSVAIVNVTANTQAYITGTANVSAGANSNVNVHATFTDNVTDNAFGGGAGLVGLGAQVAIVTDTSSAAAFIGTKAGNSNATTQVTGGGNVSITSTFTRNITASATGAEVGGLAAGAAIAQTTAGGSTAAYVGNNAHIGQNGATVGGLGITATTANTVTSTIDSVAAGIGAGSYNNASATIDPTITVDIGTGALVTVTNNVGLTNTATDNATATADAINFGVIAGGIMSSSATIDPNVLTYVGQNAQVTATHGNISLQTSHNYNGTSPISANGADATSQATTGGLAGVANTTATANANATALSYFNNNTTLNAGGNISVWARSFNYSTTNANGTAGGVVGYGEVTATSNSQGTTKAYLNDINTLTSTGNVTVGATGNDTSTATGTATSGGVVGVGGADASATSQPTVDTWFSSNSGSTSSTVGGSMNMNAYALGGASSDSEGVAAGVVGVGTNTAEAAWHPTTETYVGSNTNLSVAGDLNIGAYDNWNESGNELTSNEATVNVTSSGGGLASVQGATGSVTTSSSTLAHIMSGANVTVGGNLKVIAKSRDLVNGTGSGYSGGIAGVGSTSLTGTMYNTTEAYTDDGSGTIITDTGSGVVQFLAYGDRASDFTTSGGAGGLYGDGSASADVTMTNPITLAYLGSNTTVNAKNADVQVTAQTTTDLYSSSSQTVGGAVASNYTDATATITNGQTLADLDSNVNVSANTFELTAEEIKLHEDSNTSSSVPFDLAGTNTANSVDNVTNNTQAHIFTGTVINATSSVTINANVDTAPIETHAYTTTTGLTGTLTSTANSYKTVHANVLADSGSTINTTALTVNSTAPHGESGGFVQDATTNAQTVVQYVSEVVGTVTEVIGQIVTLWGLLGNPETVTKDIVELVKVVLGGATNTNTDGSETLTNAINFNATVNIGSAVSPSLLIDAAGNVTANGITYTKTGNEVDVDSLVNNPGTSMILNAPLGATSGHSSVAFSTSFAAVTITNLSNLDVRLQNIEVFNASNPPTIQDIAGNGTNNWTYDLQTNSSGTTVTIESLNSGGGNIYLDGHIYNPQGTTTIKDVGGTLGVVADDSIDSTTNDVTSRIITRQIYLEADAGSLGTSTSGIYLGLPTDATGTLSAGIEEAVGKLGVYLNVTGRGVAGQTSLDFTVGNISSTQGNVDVLINDSGLEQSTVQTQVTLDDGTQYTGTVVSEDWFNPATAVSNNKITLSFDHQFDEGETVTYSTGLASDGSENGAIGGLVNGNAYQVINVNSTTIELGDDFNAATAVNSEGEIVFANPVTFTTGQAIVYDDGGNTPLSGLVNGQTYYVQVIDPYTIKLADTAADAETTQRFSATGAVTSGSTFNLGHNHSFTNGEAVVYSSNGNTIGGLQNNTTYYVIVVDAQNFELSATISNGTPGSAITGLDPTQATGMQSLVYAGIPIQAGTGTQHLIIALNPSTATGVNQSIQTDSTYIDTTDGIVRVLTADIASTQNIVTSGTQYINSTVTLQGITASLDNVTVVVGSGGNGVRTDALIASTVSSIHGSATISATGSIQDSGAGTDLTAITANLSAGYNIGAGSNTPLKTAIATLGATAGTQATSGLYLTNSGDLSTNGVSASGDIDLTATASGGQTGCLSVTTGTSVTSSNGAITLQADRNITVPAGATVTAHGKVILNGDRAGNGGNFTLTGKFNSSENDVNGGTGTDSVTATNDANFTLGNTYLDRYISGLLDDAFVLTGIENAYLTGGAGNNSFTVSDWTGVGTLNGGASGTDTVVASKNNNFTLTNTSLVSTDGMNMALVHIGVANLTGGVSNNTFDVSGWTGTGSLDGGAGGTDTVIAIKDKNFTLTNTSLVTTDGMSMTLARIGVADLTGGASNNTFDVSGWTGTGFVNGGSGGTTDTVSAVKAVSSFVLTNSELKTSDLMDMQLINIQDAWLTDSVGGRSTFDLTGWTGKGGLSNKSTTVSDSITVNKTVSVTLTNKSVTSGDGMAMSLSGLFSSLSGTDSIGGHTDDFSGWVGTVNLANTGATADTLTGSKYADVTLTNTKLTSSDGLTLNMTGVYVVNIMTLGGNHTVDVSGFTRTGSISTNAPYTDTVVATKNASFVLSNSLLTATDGMSMTLNDVTVGDLTDSGGGHSFDVSNWTGSGKLANSGTTADTITVTKSADIVLSNTSLTSSDGMSMQLAGKMGTANLTDKAGGAGGHTFTVSNWTGKGSLVGQGLAPSKVVAAKNANFTLTNGLLSGSDSMSMTLSNIVFATLTDTGGSHSFDVSGWTGSGSLTGSGATPSIVIATKNANFTLGKTLLTTSDGMSMTLMNIGTANLTDTGGSHFFNVTNWTGKGTLTGDSNNTDEVIKNAVFSHVGNALTSSDGMSLTLAYIAQVLKSQ